MNTKAIVFLSLCLVTSPVFADFNKNSRGTTTANFLKLGVGARAVGMGEAYAAAAEDATAPYWNPAGMANVEKNAATFMHAPYLESTYYDYVGYVHRFDKSSIGFSAQYFSAGSLDETDENNTALGSFNPYDVALGLSYARRLGDEGWAIGATGKLIQSKIIDTASTVAVDAGMQSRWFRDIVRLAFTVTHIGGEMKFEEEGESLPLALRFGSAWRLSRRWLATGDVIMPRDNSPFLAMGTEYAWMPTSRMQVAARAGYSSRTAGDVDGLTGLSMGFGIGFDALEFDYALLPLGDLGLTHRISIGLKWGRLRTNLN